MHVCIEPFEVYTVAGGWVATDPTALSAVVKAWGAGAQVEDLGSILADKIEVGRYYATVTDGSYTDGTRYEIHYTATLDGEATTGVQPFTFRAIDNTPTAAPTVALAGYTTTTAAFNLTDPADADFDHCEAELYGSGSGSPTQVNPFTGSLTGLSAGGTYTVVVFGIDNSGNRSRPSNMVTFTTLRTAGGTYNLTVALRVDGNGSDDASGNVDIDTVRHSVPFHVYGTRGRLHLRMTEVDQSLTIRRLYLKSRVLYREADV